MIKKIRSWVRWANFCGGYDTRLRRAGYRLGAIGFGRRQIFSMNGKFVGEVRS